MSYSETQYLALLERQQMTDEETAAQQRRTQAGAQARVHGDSFESRIDAQNKAYVALHLLATTIRQMPPMRPRYERTKTKIVFEATGPGPCDRVFVLPSGLFGVFDCKSSSSQNQFSWPKDQEHQLQELRHIHEVTVGRSPAFALVYWREHEAVTVHPAWTIDGRTVRRADGYSVSGYDWLPTVKMLWGIA